MTSRRTFFISTLTSLEALAAAKSANLEMRVAKRDFRGLTREDLPTPCMILDLDLFEKNLKHMATHCKTNNLQLRGHVKIHKSTEIAKRQVALGAIGVTVATVAEAELMSGAGIKGVLLTSNAAGKEKTARAIAIARRDPTFAAVADDPAMIDQFNAAAGAAGCKLNLVVDVYAGLTRHGCQPGEPAMELVRKTLASKNLNFRGLMAYSGTASHTKNWQSRRERSRADLAGMLETAEMCRKAGIEVPIRTGGSTGTYNIDVGALTELQAGSYMFMDTGYIKIGGRNNDALYDDFAQSLTILTTVISKRHNGQATIDCGIKGMIKETDTVKGRPDMKVAAQGAEYGLLKWAEGAPDLKLGDKMELYPTHLDSTTNVYDRYYVAKGENIVDAWSVMGRAGAAQR